MQQHSYSSHESSVCCEKRKVGHTTLGRLPCCLSLFSEPYKGSDDASYAQKCFLEISENCAEHIWMIMLG